MTPIAFLGMLAAIGAFQLTTLQTQPVAGLGASTGVPGDPSSTQPVAWEQSLIDLTNADRAANGVAPVQFDPDTLPIARERAQSQLGTQSLNHYAASGELVITQLLDEADTSYGLAGENLARASATDEHVCHRVEDGLMKSPTHRENILNKTFTRMSVGVATDPTTGQIAFAEVYRD